MHGQRPRFRRRSAPNNAIEEGQDQAGLGDIPEDLFREHRIRPPILTPRGRGTDNPFTQMPPVGAPPPAVRNFNPQALSTYNVELPAGVPTQLYGASRERAYSFIVNSGANDAVLTYGRQTVSAVDGIPLASGGDGFHELVNGNVGTAWAFATAATTLTVTEGRYDPPMES